MADDNRDRNHNLNDEVEGLKNRVVDLDARMDRMEGMFIALMERMNIQHNHNRNDNGD